LAQAGFGPENPLTLKVYYFIQEEQRQVAIATQGMWRKIGVEAEIFGVQFGGLFLLRKKGDFDAIFTNLFAGFDDPIPFLSQYETRNIPIGANPSRYSNANYDRLVSEADQILGPAKRLEMLQAAERTLVADYPVAPIYFFNYRRLINPKVKGWFDNPLGINLSRYLSIED
jgi:ABC-type oligopeptide transport system substrate-binding subunit